MSLLKPGAWRPSIMTLAQRSRFGWLVLRLALAGLVAAHGYYRLLTGGSFGFGEWLASQNIPFGLVVAWAVTMIEVIGSVLLAIGRLVLPVALVLSAIYVVGIVMVHAPSGWFVVGAGRNGAEYSALLIVALLCVGLQHAPSREAP
jgi:putative oxidoreductase